MVKTEFVVDGELIPDVNFASDRIGRETNATTALHRCARIPLSSFSFELFPLRARTVSEQPWSLFAVFFLTEDVRVDFAFGPENRSSTMRQQPPQEFRSFKHVRCPRPGGYSSRRHSTQYSRLGCHAVLYWLLSYLSAALQFVQVGSVSPPAHSGRAGQRRSLVVCSLDTEASPV